jgi:transcription antitermination factor NusG
MILAAEPDLVPGDLFDGPAPADGRAWWLAHTKPRQEKALARDLVTAGVSFYLPCVPHRTRVRTRVLTAYAPLFPGYAFVRVGDADRNRVFATNRVARLVPVADQDRLWADLRGVRRVLDLGRPVTAEDRLPPGTPVVVRSGPLFGLRGTVVRSAAGRRFVVLVDLIHRGVSVTVDAETLGEKVAC